MLVLRDRRVRILLAVGLVLLGLGAAYLIGVRVWANAAYQAAVQDLKRYDFVAAAASLEEYLSLFPADSEARLLAAQTARRSGDFAAAQEQLNLAEKHGAPAQAVATEWQLLRTQAGNLTDAMALANYCHGRPNSPATTLALEVLIEGSMEAPSPSGAKWAIDQWLKHRKGALDQARGLVWRGRFHVLSHDIPQALADLREAVDLAPDYLPARLRLVEILLREDPRQAAPHLEQMQVTHPADPEVRLLAARLHRALGRPEEAARLLDALLGVVPDRVSVLVERGRVALDLNRPDDAERALLRARELAPDLRDVNLALADCLRQAGRLDEARPYQARVKEIDARLEKSLEELARKSKGADGK